MNPLGTLLFPEKTTHTTKNIVTRSENSCKAKSPAPGCVTLAANLLSRAWNESADLQNAQTLGAAKKAASKWSKTLVKG